MALGNNRNGNMLRYAMLTPLPRRVCNPSLQGTPCYSLYSEESGIHLYEGLHALVSTQESLSMSIGDGTNTQSDMYPIALPA